MKNRLYSILMLCCLLTIWYACTEEDLCQDIVCINGGVCVDGTCDCPEGFGGFNCETSLDPCEGVICFNNGTCIDGSCICPNGYTGEFCETPPVVDPCLGLNCLNGGNCIDGTCNCINGYTGANCETPPADPCAGVTCFNGGTCVNGICDCINGYSGPNCEIGPSDPCAGIVCFNGGTCVDGICDCINGYTGPNCEIAPADPCAGIVCFNGGTCVDGICDCINGYTGPNCEIAPTDPCAGVVCENGGVCAIGQDGNPVCDCPEGFYGATCELIECFIVDCPPNSSCVDDGLGNCECNVGYEPGEDPNTGIEGCIPSSIYWVGDYTGQETCAIGGDSELYDCTITVDEVDPTIIFLNNLGGFDFAVGALIENPTRISIPEQDFDLGGFVFRIVGTSFGTQNNDTGNIGVSYKFTCFGCGDNGADLSDECDAALIRQ